MGDGSALRGVEGREHVGVGGYLLGLTQNPDLPPLPQAGEGWGEGAKSNICVSPNLY